MKQTNIKNHSIESFLKLLDKGISDSENAVTKGLMEDVTESLLFSQNVNIPLLHMFLPLNYKGMYMFSEIWIGRMRIGLMIKESPKITNPIKYL